jgi:hypothetical protein
MAKPDLYQAVEAFGIQLDGEWMTVQKDDLVRAGHPLLKQAPDRFKPAEGYVRFEVEQATAAPGEKRGAPKDEPKNEKGGSKAP